MRVLCVDDELNILEGLSLHLRKSYEVECATSGVAALDMLRKNGTTAVILSDMRMPGMDGAAFLAQARQVVPDAVRILLTGQGDLNAAIAAVNEGQIFRFLTKPCPPPTLLLAVETAAEQHRLITAERVLLEQTLHGSIKTLTDVLSLTNPASFGRAIRIKLHVSELARQLDIRERWQVEVAAMLSQIGYITLPTETVEKVYYGQALSEEEQKMVSRLPAITEQLLGHIPRLEVVRGILKNYARPFGWWSNSEKSDPQKQLIVRGATILRVAVDFDALEAQGNPPALTIDTMRGRQDRYDPEVLAALAAIRGVQGPATDVRELPLRALQVGMLIAEDVKMQTGGLLVTRGYEVTAGFLERLRNFSPGMVKEPVRIIVRSGRDAA